MNTVVKVLAGVFGLIMIYLFLSKADETNKVLSTAGDFFLRGTAVLQGRPDVIGVNLRA